MVRLNDRPHMTLDVYRGRKTTTTTTPISVPNKLDRKERDSPESCVRITCVESLETMHTIQIDTFLCKFTGEGGATCV